MTTETQPVTYDNVLRLALRLQLAERARLSSALAPDIAQERTAQREKNQAAIALLHSWRENDEEDDGEGSWEDMLRSLDEYRYSTRLLFS